MHKFNIGEWMIHDPEKRIDIPVFLKSDISRTLRELCGIIIPARDIKLRNRYYSHKTKERALGVHVYGREIGWISY